MSWLLPNLSSLRAFILPRRHSRPTANFLLRDRAGSRAARDIRTIQSKVVAGRVDKQSRYNARHLQLKRTASSSASTSSVESEVGQSSSYANSPARVHDDLSETSSVATSDGARQEEEVARQLQLFRGESAHLIETQIVNEWSADEQWLFNKLKRRGQEPLMPELWQWDFPSYPDDLFTMLDDYSFIKNLATPVTEAVDEFQTLVDSGPRCRDNLLQDNSPEPPLAKAIRRYKTWSLRDGQLFDKKFLDLTIVVQAGPHEGAGAVVDRATRKLKALKQQWRDTLQDSQDSKTLDVAGQQAVLPTLFAFVVKYSLVSILSLDPNPPNAPVRTLESLDHQIELRDVWHALAISITCIHARNQLLRLDQMGAFSKLHRSVEDVDA